MEMNRKKQRVLIAGGGSTYTAGIVTMLLENMDRFPIESIKLYDNNEERQRKVAEACAIIAREKNPEVKFSYTTDPEEAFYTVPYEYKVTALDINKNPIKVLVHRKIDENQGCEIVRTDVKHYLRFTYLYKYEENTKREWLHIVNDKEWY